MSPTWWAAFSVMGSALVAFLDFIGRRASNFAQALFE
jgi:hypothetical protein